MSRQGNPQNSPEMPAPLALHQMIYSYQISQSLHVVAKLGIADLLKDGPRSSNELATDVGAHPDALYSVLRALTSVGVFAEVDKGRFTLTPLAALLQSGVPGSMRVRAIFTGELLYRPWGELLHSVKTGESAFDHLYGMGVSEYLAQNAEASESYNAMMTANTQAHAEAVVAAYNFSGITTVIDVGGGHGALLAAILRANPQMRGVLFDLPHVIAGAGHLLVAEGVAERCESVGGDFFEAVPEGGDGYILKTVIHDWDDERAVAILKNCRRAMEERGKLLLVERVMPVGHTSASVWLSEMMWADVLRRVTRGKERTADEFQVLLEAAGFTLTNIIPTQSQISVIEGVRA